MRENKIVVVLSLGRSGTSALTRGLKVLGVNLGEALSKNLPELNQKGLWEDSEIDTISRKIMLSLYTHFQSWKVDGVGEIEFDKTPAHLRDEALKIIRRNLEKYGSYGFKSIITWKIIPFWKWVFNQLAINPTYIIAVRNPISVEESLAKIGLKRGPKLYALWLECIVTIMHETYGENRIVIDYDQLIDNPEHQLRRIARVMNIDDRDIDEMDLEDYLQKFIDKKLNHANPSCNRIEENTFFPAMALNCYRLLQELAADNIPINSSEANCSFDNFYSQLNNFSQFFKALNCLEDRFLNTRSSLEDALLNLVQLQTANWKF